MRFLKEETRQEAFQGFSNIKNDITRMSAIVQNKVPIESEDANKLFKEMLDVKERITEVVSLVVNGYKDAKEVNKLSMEQLGEKLCDYCEGVDSAKSYYNEHGINICAGSYHCDVAYDNYLDSDEDEEE